MAVHGLGGDAFDTWEDEINIWLRDFVPSQTPSARVTSFGHDSIIAFSKSVAGIEELAPDLVNRLNNAIKNARRTTGLALFLSSHASRIPKLDWFCEPRDPKYTL